MNKRRLILKGFCSEVNQMQKTADLKKEANPFMATLRSLKALRSISSLKNTNTAKAISSVIGAGKKKGVRGALERASKFKSPEVNLPKNIPNKLTLPKEQNIPSSLGRGLRSAAGNISDNILSLTRGLGSGNTKDKAIQVGKNLKDTVTKQLRGSQYTEKEFTDINKAKDIFTKGDKKYLKSKARFLPDREVIQETGRGVLVKKRAPMRAIAPFTTSPGAAGAAGSSFLAQNLLEPEKPMSKKLTQSLTDGGRFLGGDAVGFASYLL